MLNIHTVRCNELQENCYIVWDETNEAVIIDPGMRYANEKEAVKKFINDNNLTLKHMLNTHLHFDHSWGISFINHEFGLKPEAHGGDIDIYQRLDQQVAMFMGDESHEEIVPLGRCLNEGDTVTFGSHAFSIIETPGHTNGGICLYCEAEKVLFTGDSLFRMSIGRTDFPGGSYEALSRALKTKIMTLPDDVTAYPGHGPETNIGEEKLMNPYI
ncbi:MAG: MBL fold metallo-hydrolase [Bacteroidaceae bacterium]|nr:MBL fold metallo-hydrolase [Bacteroidaceae bacterium]